MDAKKQRLAFLIEQLGLTGHTAEQLILHAMERAFDEGMKAAGILVAREMTKALVEPEWLGENNATRI